MMFDLRKKLEPLLSKLHDGLILELLPYGEETISSPDDVGPGHV